MTRKTYYVHMVIELIQFLLNFHLKELLTFQQLEGNVCVFERELRFNPSLIFG